MSEQLPGTDDPRPELDELDVSMQLHLDVERLIRIAAVCALAALLAAAVALHTAKRA
jgi:hypothetical protein